MVKEFFNKLYFLFFISIIFICVFSCTQFNEGEKSDKNHSKDQKKESKEKSEEEGTNENEEIDEKADTPLAVIKLGENDFVEIIEPEDGDLYVCGVSSSIEQMRKVRSMTLVELYKKYVGNDVPDKLIQAEVRSKYTPIMSNLSINSDSTLSKSLTFGNALNYYYEHFPDTIVVESVSYCNAVEHDFKEKAKKPYYISAVAGADSGQFNYRMYRRVIKAFGDNYWKTVFGPCTVYDGGLVWAWYSPDNYREVRSHIYNNTGYFHHILGGN